MGGGFGRQRNKASKLLSQHHHCAFGSNLVFEKQNDLMFTQCLHMVKYCTLLCRHDIFSFVYPLQCNWTS